MTKSTKNAIIVTSCAIILGAVLFCIRFLPEKKQDDIKSDTQSINIISESVGNINNINIINQYGEYVVELNNNKKLQINEFDGYPRNDSAYEDLAEKVCNFTASKVVSEGDGNLNIYGLDYPIAQILVNYNNNLNVEFLVGSQAPSDLGYYVKQQDKSVVYLVSNSNISPFLKSKLSYISLAITSPESAGVNFKDLEYIELMGGNRNEGIKIKKFKKSSKDDTKIIYNIIEPNKKRISEQGEEVIYSIENILAEKVEVFNPSQADINKYNFNNPFAKLILKYKNREPIEILVALADNNEDYLIMKKDVNIIYRAPKESLKWVETQVDDLTSITEE